MGRNAPIIGGQRVLAVIPARGGSKEVPRKNIRVVGGKPLIAWTIQAAAASRYLDRTVLSSDDDEIINMARAYGCEVPFKRDAALAHDDTPGTAVLLDALDRCPGYDWVMLLQPTSPLRSTEDIDGAIEKCFSRNAPSCVSVCEAAQSPYWMCTVGSREELLPLMPSIGKTNRQELPPVFLLNGAIYLARSAWIRETRDFSGPNTIAYQMPFERSIDLDSEEDIRQLAQRLAARLPSTTDDYIQENQRAHSAPIVNASTLAPLVRRRHNYQLVTCRAAVRDLLVSGPRFFVNRLVLNSEYSLLRRCKAQGKGKKALILGNGPSQGYLSAEIFARFQSTGNDIWVVNFWNKNTQLSSLCPNNLVISDPATLDFANSNADERLRGNNQSLLEYLLARPKLNVFCPVQRAKPLRTLLPAHRVTGFSDDQLGFTGNISPLFPRGYISMTLYKVLALTVFFGYDEIYILGMDNTYPRDLYNTIDNRPFNLERHANGSYYSSMYLNNVASELFTLAHLFNDLALFTKHSKGRITNLDPYSLVDAFPKVPTVESGLAKLS